MSDISKVGVREWPVSPVLVGEPAPSDQATSSRTRSPVASELTARAAGALDRARKMPPGGERTEAMRKATTLENAAEMLRHLSGKGDAPAK